MKHKRGYFRCHMQEVWIHSTANLILIEIPARPRTSQRHVNQMHFVSIVVPPRYVL
jgi:hypothetical protein